MVIEDDKIFLFIDVDENKYATAQQTQFDAESEFQFSYGEDLEYTIKEVALTSIMNDNKIEWF